MYLSNVELALSAEVHALISAQSSHSETNPFSTVLADLDVQTVSLIIRDLEDAPRLSSVDERTMQAAIKACRTEGERRVGRSMFDSYIAEYE